MRRVCQAMPRLWSKTTPSGIADGLLPAGRIFHVCLMFSGSSVPAGAQTLNVYAHTGGKGWWFKGVSVTGGGTGTGTAAPAPAAAAPAASAPAAAASSSTAGGAPVLIISNPTENQKVTTKASYTINGSVSDSANIDRIEVWINGERDATAARLLGTTTPSSDGSWSVSFSPNPLCFDALEHLRVRAQRGHERGVPGGPGLQHHRQKVDKHALVPGLRGAAPGRQPHDRRSTPSGYWADGVNNSVIVIRR